MNLTKIFFIAIFLLSPIIAFSQEYIKVPDTILVHNGQNYKLPIYADLKLDEVNSISVKFNYSYSLIDINSVQTTESTIMSGQNPVYNINVVNKDTSEIIISTESINKSGNSVLCYIELETLYGLDSLAFFNPIEVKINGEIKENVSLIPAQIKVGYALEPIIKEGISKVYPNPFDGFFIVEFGIENPTKLDFGIFSSLGQNVMTVPNPSGLNYTFTNSKGEVIVNPLNYEFAKGHYKLEIKAIPWEFSSGLYFLQLTTKSGFFNTNLLHIK